MSAHDALVALDQQYVMNTYARRPVAFVAGQGMELVAADGSRYLDFLAGISTVNLGYSDPVVTQAIADQAAQVIHTSNLYYAPHRAELAQDLVQLFGAPAKVFFANSGAEANEAAIKLARRWAAQHKPQATTILTALNSFHGRTLATVAATGQPERAVPFAPVPQGFAHVPFNDTDALEAAVGPDTIAVMLEPVQGESGVWPATPQYLQRAQELCRQHGALLIFDEVQTGMYRTGSYPFAFQRYGLAPDIVTSAKALANGVPIGAAIATVHVAGAFVPGDHGSTFGGGALACAAARATLAQLSALKLGQNSEEMGEYLRAKLADIPGIGQVRGLGLMVGFTISDELAATLGPTPAKTLSDALLDRHVIVNAIGQRHIRLLPPLICNRSHIDTLCNALYAIIEQS